MSQGLDDASATFRRCQTLTRAIVILSTCAGGKWLRLTRANGRSTSENARADTLELAISSDEPLSSQLLGVDTEETP